MRKFTYKRNTAIIRTLKEPQIKKKKLNIDRILYFILIACILFFGINFIYNKTVWVEGNGQVFMEKVDVNFTNDIRVKEIFIHEGGTVEVGDTLFNYYQDAFDGDANLMVKNIERKERRSKSIQDIENDVTRIQVQLRNLSKRLQLLEHQAKQTAKLILLDVYTKNKLDDITNQKLLVQNQVDLLRSELVLLQRQKQQLNSNSYALSGGIGSNFGSTYVSPIKGVIGQILKNSEESCYKAENVMTIHNVEKVFIKAYFNLKDVAKIEKGSIVDVEFPDKSISKGVIHKVYISTYRAPSEFQKKYEPTERNILAEIIPLHKEQIPEWGKYHKLNLKVKVDNLL